MNREHIPFENLEFDREPDHSHLSQCRSCRMGWAIFRFLAFQVTSTPQVEVPPFFAGRVAEIIRSVEAPFALFFQRAARQLIPVFAVLVLGTSVLFYAFATTESPDQYYTQMFFEEPLPEELSLENVVDSLSEPPEEGAVQ